MSKQQASVDVLVPTLEDKQLVEAFINNVLPIPITWNDLMPVVEKIRNIWNEENLDLQLLEEDNDASKIKNLRVWAEITSVWQAVIKFIIWYNTQTKKQ